MSLNLAHSGVRVYLRAWECDEKIEQYQFDRGKLNPHKTLNADKSVNLKIAIASINRR